MTLSPHVERARALIPAIAERAPETESGRRVPQDLSDQLGEAGFFRMLAPKAVGGGEVTPREFADVLFELGRGDGAAGWVAMTGSTTGLLLGYVAEDAAREILADGPNAGLAGVFAPTGRAVPEGDGYRLSGRWQWGSGCQNARWRMGGALVFDGERPRMLDGGGPEIRSCFYRADDSTVIDTWRTAGLRGTGSHDLVVEDVFVPASHTACVMADAPLHEGPLFRFPLFGLLATGVASVGLGIARAALDHTVTLAANKKSRGGKKSMAESELVQVSLAKAEGQLLAARALMHATLEEVYAHASAGRPLEDDHRARLRLSATHAGAVAADVTGEAYHLAGGASVWDSHPLSRCFRDVNVMTQHIMVARETYKPIGRLMLGLETNTALL
ncbi:MAG: acyl-CoA dehydrogenase family protein [Sandaracinaceae bacterium]